MNERLRINPQTNGVTSAVIEVDVMIGTDHSVEVVTPAETEVETEVEIATQAETETVVEVGIVPLTGTGPSVGTETVMTEVATTMTVIVTGTETEVMAEMAVTTTVAISAAEATLEEEFASTVSCVAQQTTHISAARPKIRSTFWKESTVETVEVATSSDPIGLRTEPLPQSQKF
jgi:hypothetical protein